MNFSNMARAENEIIKIKISEVKKKFRRKEITFDQATKQLAKLYTDERESLKKLWSNIVEEYK